MITFEECQKLVENCENPKLTALKLYGILIGRVKPDRLSGTEKYLNWCYNRPEENYLIMYAANILLEGYGIEYIEEYRYYYVNMGDTYNYTVIWDNNDFIASSWGDYYEKCEREENDID